MVYKVYAFTVNKDLNKSISMAMSWHAIMTMYTLQYTVYRV